MRTWKAFRRWLARQRAELGGYFWTVCPVCRREFGGQEWRGYGGHQESIPELDSDGNVRSVGTAICPDCTRDGVGCYVSIRLGRKLAFHECEHAWRAWADLGDGEARSATWRRVKW